MKEQIIKQILSNKLLNKKELVTIIGRKGLSVPSMYNKLNPDHVHKFKKEELEEIEKELKKFAKNILELLAH